ncbi:MAG: Uma2 family endonuclease [Phycisphaerae bacterium]
MTSTAKKIWTDAELLALPHDGHDYEIVDGELMMSPASMDHGAVITTLTIILGHYVRARRLGRLLDGQTGCRMKSGDLFSPDISFVTQKRWVACHKTKGVFFPGAPDLVIEVLSPSDTMGVIEEKFRQYFENGAKLAWLVNPVTRTVLVYHRTEPAGPPSADKLLTIHDQLSGESLIPGFKLPITEIFE